MTTESLSLLAPPLPPWWPVATTDITVEALTREGCLQRLVQARAGSLSYLQLASPPSEAVPFRIDGPDLILAPPPTRLPCVAASPQLVLFKVDQVAPDLRSGWTVVTVGRLIPRTADRDERRHPLTIGVFALDLLALTGRAVSTTT